jgi:hypothetical protein
MMIEGSGSGAGPGLWLTDPDPGGPKTYGSHGYESGSATLVRGFTSEVVFEVFWIRMGSWNRNAKMKVKRRKRNKFTVWSAGYSLSEAWGLSCSLEVLHGGIMIIILKL